MRAHPPGVLPCPAYDRIDSVEFVLRNSRPVGFDVAPGLGRPRELPGDLDKLLQVVFAIAGIRRFALS
eukprot:1051611-Lingulodinium_polyedra.AAC.1